MPSTINEIYNIYNYTNYVPDEEIYVFSGALDPLGYGDQLVYNGETKTIQNTINVGGDDIGYILDSAFSVDVLGLVIGTDIDITYYQTIASISVSGGKTTITMDLQGTLASDPAGLGINPSFEVFYEGVALPIESVGIPSAELITLTGEWSPAPSVGDRISIVPISVSAYYFGGMYDSTDATADSVGGNASPDGLYFLRVVDSNGDPVTGLPEGGSFISSYVSGGAVPAVLGAETETPGVYQLTSGGTDWWIADVADEIYEIGDPEAAQPDPLTYTAPSGGGGGVPSKPTKPAVAKVEKPEGVAEITKPEGVAQVVKPEGVAKITKG